MHPLAHDRVLRICIEAWRPAKALLMVLHLLPVLHLLQLKVPQLPVLITLRPSDALARLRVRARTPPAHTHSLLQVKA